MRKIPSNIFLSRTPYEHLKINVKTFKILIPSKLLSPYLVTT